MSGASGEAWLTTSVTDAARRRGGREQRGAAAPDDGAFELPSRAATVPAAAYAPAHLVGLIDVRAASALLLGALPLTAVLRRRPPRIPDRLHAWAYVGLLGVVAVASGLRGWR
ncbi:hypothetical protein [Streptomyces sp. NPDC002853]